MGRHHARVYTELLGATLVGVVDENEERRSAVAARHDCPGLTTVDELLKLGVDAVSIAAPTIHHLSIAAPLLKAGVACLIEKPLAPSVDEARQLAYLAHSTGSTLQVGHIERYNPAVRALGAFAADSGFTIVPRFMEIHRVSPMTFRSVDVSVVFDMMIHDLDLVLMLVGGVEPTEIQASGVDVITEHADLCNARLRFDTPNSPCVANITASRLAFKSERKIRIIAQDAYVSIDYAKKAGVVIRKTANESQLAQVREGLRMGQDLSDLDYQELVHIENLAIDDAEPLRMQLQSFLEALRSGRRPDVDAEAGFAAVRTAERIVNAAKVELAGSAR